VTVREHVLALFQRHLSGKLKPTGASNYQATCPFHKGGHERTPSFSVNVEKGVFHCFTCHEAGGVKRFLRMLGVPRSTIDAETKSVDTFLQRNEQNARLAKRHAFAQKDPFKANPVLPEALLSVYDFEPMKLIEDGFERSLLRDLDIGYDRRNDRITYPLRDLYGDLAGISGGAMKEEQQPKYKVYQGGRHDQMQHWIEGDFGKSFDEEFPGYTCENHQYLWNYDRVYPRLIASSDPDAKVHLVEGFKACIWMLQAGLWNTVALMGSYISDNQQRLLHRLGCPVVLFLDNDQAGREGTLNIGDRLYKPMHGRVKVMPYPHNDVMSAIGNPQTATQPDDYELEALRDFDRSAVLFTQHFNYMRRLISW
jgi:DNA primase